jgi:hypothetical protein
MQQPHNESVPLPLRSVHGAVDLFLVLPTRHVTWRMRETIMGDAAFWIPIFLLCFFAFVAYVNYLDFRRGEGRWWTVFICLLILIIVAATLYPPYRMALSRRKNYPHHSHLPVPIRSAYSAVDLFRRVAAQHVVKA